MRRLAFASCFLAVFAVLPALLAQPIPVHQRMGSLHGFLLLYDQNGKVIASGEQVNFIQGNDIHARLTLHFRDGSLDDEQTIFRQGRTFGLIQDHHVQKGPSYPTPLDLTINVPKGEVTWLETSKKGGQMKHKHMNLPPDLINGMVSLAVQNFPAHAGQMKLSYLSVDSGPRLVHFVLTPDGVDTMQLGGQPLRAQRFNVHIDISGIAGVIAPAVGKQPADFKLWIDGGAVPVFVKMTGALYPDGPVWTMAFAAPRWPQEK